MKFKHGDMVYIAGDSVCGYPTGTVFCAVDNMPEQFRSYWIADGFVQVESLNDKDGWATEEGRWALVRDRPNSPIITSNLCEEIPLPGEELGTYRPVLETRKAGKVRVELVDDGFPLALREVAKVMTWAQTAKGYKDHDWQNLPDAQVQLAAAASRHRTDQIIQHVVEGKPLYECLDDESELVHKAHEAFGVLAQLELMLREKRLNT